MIWVWADRKDLINLLPLIVVNASSPLLPISEACVLGRVDLHLNIHSRSLASIPADREKYDVPKNPFIQFYIRTGFFPWVGLTFVAFAVI